MNSTGPSSSVPRCLRMAFTAERRKYALVMPRIATGYWNAKNTPSRARSSGVMAKRSFPSYSADPAVTVYAGCPARTWASVDLPEPFGPMMAWTSPLFTRRSTPRRISFFPTPACRFLISRNIRHSTWKLENRNSKLVTARPGLLKQARHLHREPRQQLGVFQQFVSTPARHSREPVNVDLAILGVGHPHPLASGGEVVADALIDFAGRVGGRNHFHRQVGRALRERIERQFTPSLHEAHIRSAHCVAREMKMLHSNHRAASSAVDVFQQSHEHLVPHKIVQEHLGGNFNQLSFHELVAHVTATDRLRKPYEIFHRQMRFGCHGLSSSLEHAPLPFCKSRRLRRQACAASAPLTAIAPGHRA